MLLIALVFYGDKVKDFYIVGIHIGNIDDITFRAVKILNSVDFIVCENETEYRKFFGQLSIPVKKFIVCGQNSENEAAEITIQLLKNGEKGALISDCGVPLFEDPGFDIIDRVRNNGFSYTSIPGANSLATALSLSPFKVKNFYFKGFIARKHDDRIKDIKDIAKMTNPIVLMESPYRLINILELAKEHLGNRKIFLPYNLTMPDEMLMYDTPSSLIKKLKSHKIEKGEFLIIIEGLK